MPIPCITRPFTRETGRWVSGCVILSLIHISKSVIRIFFRLLLHSCPLFGFFPVPYSCLVLSLIPIFRPAQHTAFDKEKDPTKKGDFRRTQRENLSYSLDLTASYNKLFGQVHYVTANARMSVQESRNESYGAYVTGFPNENKMCIRDRGMTSQ